MKKYLGILNLNEIETNIQSLTKRRTIASIPVAGRYRVIDFVLSNMVNANISKIGVFTNYKSRSLVDHLNGGKPWDLDRKNDGLFIFNFGTSDIYVNDINILRDNIEFFNLSKEEYVILSSSYMICNIDLVEVCEEFEQSGTDIMVVYHRARNCKKEFMGCDVVNLDDLNNVISFGKNTGAYSRTNISMEMYIMKKSVLIEMINDASSKGYYKRIKDVINNSSNHYHIRGYDFKGYLKCINSIRSYASFNFDCLDLTIRKELFYNKNKPIYTKVKDEVPTKYGEECVVQNSIIANGCQIEGTVINSVISRRVNIKKGAVVKNAVIMQNVVIDKDVRLENVIIDKNAHIEKGKVLIGDPSYPIIIEKEMIL